MKDRIDSKKLQHHIKNIEDAKRHLPYFRKDSKLGKKMEAFKSDDIDEIAIILNNASIRLDEDRSRHSKQVPSTAEVSSKQLEDYITIDPRKSTSKLNDRKFISDTLAKLDGFLEIKDNLYKPLALSDKYLGLDDKKFMFSRREQRRAIKDCITKGRLKYSVVLHTYSIGGQYPDLLTIFRVPSARKRKEIVDEYTAEVTNAIFAIRKDAIVIDLKQTSKELDALLGTMCKNDPKIEQQLKKIFEVADLNDIIALHGDTIDEAVLKDQRYLNSRGGKGDGHTKFQIFFDKCKTILQSTGAAEERRHGPADVVHVHSSTVTSLKNLRAKAIAALQEDVRNGKLLEEPPYPSEATISRQFSPNDETVKAAEKLTGRLGVIRKVQRRTLRNQHPDQHFVNASTKYFKEKLVDCRNKCGRKTVRFYGQDDKAKIPVGTDIPISSNARRIQAPIVPTDPSLNTNFAADHDWSNASIIPSVTMHGNVPNDYNGSFFGGGEGGDGEITVTLNDATFNKSDVFVHTAQLLLDLRTRHAEPGSEKSAADELMLLLLQTDGGPDHNLNFLRSRLALMGMFLLLDVDAMDILRGAPRGSALNTVERCMAILNFALCDIALMRGIMSAWAEALVANLNSMKEVRDAHEKNKKQQELIERSRVQFEKRKAEGDCK